MPAILKRINSLLESVDSAQLSKKEMHNAYRKFDEHMTMLKQLAIMTKDDTVVEAYLDIYKRINPNFGQILQGGHEYDELHLVKELNIQMFQFKNFANRQEAPSANIHMAAPSA